MIKKSSSPLLVTKHMRVSDIVALCPGAEKVMAEYGIHCAGCAMNMQETLAEGSVLHGFGDDELEALVEDLNDVLKEMPPRPHTLTVTAAAAKAFKDIAKTEKRKEKGLAVIVDEHGGFCMEFKTKPAKDEKTFKHTDVKGIEVYASEMTLMRIGGSTIDFREGRFKLDLPAGDKANAACGCDGTCDCR